jgi:cytochrome P450
VGNQQPVRLNREFIQHPHELYRRLRAEGPAHPVTISGSVPAWLITRYGEARRLLNDPRLGKDHAKVLELFPPGTGSNHDTALAAHMLHSDPPDHTRLRRLVSKAFTARTVDRLRPRIERTADELLDGIAASDRVDLIESFALPLPLQVISSMLGVPKDDQPKFKDWTEPLITRALPEERQLAHDALTNYLQGLIAAKRAEPTDDLISELVGATDQGDRLSEPELLAMVFLLIVAGYETTVNLIGNGVLALLHNPSQLAELRADPTLLPGAVEEFLRYDSPLNLATIRFTTVPITVGGVHIPADQFVLISLLAANHDGDQFDHPDQLDVRRTDSAHLAFGHGIHYCLGAPLARLEGQVALGRLLRRFRTIELDTEAPPPRYRTSTLMRGLESLPLRLTI